MNGPDFHLCIMTLSHNTQINVILKKYGAVKKKEYGEKMSTNT